MRGTCAQGGLWELRKPLTPTPEDTVRRIFVSYVVLTFSVEGAWGGGGDTGGMLEQKTARYVIPKRRDLYIGWRHSPP